MMATECGAAEQVDQWNADVPEGTSVIFDYSGTKVRTKTRGRAFVLNGKPMVSLVGLAGAVAMESVTISPYRSWVRLNRRGQVSHWVESDFESREAMERQINDMMRLDKRIESYETSVTRPVDA